MPQAPDTLLFPIHPLPLAISTNKGSADLRVPPINWGGHCAAIVCPSCAASLPAPQHLWDLSTGINATFSSDLKQSPPLPCLSFPDYKAAAHPTPPSPCCSNVSAQSWGPSQRTTNKPIYKYCIFPPRHPSSMRSTRSPGLTLSPRVHLNSKRRERFLTLGAWAAGQGTALEGGAAWEGNPQPALQHGSSKAALQAGKTKARQGQRGEGKHIFLGESLSLPPQEEGPVRGTACSNLLTIAHSLPLTSPAHPSNTGKFSLKASLLLLSCLGG